MPTGDLDVANFASQWHAGTLKGPFQTHYAREGQERSLPRMVRAGVHSATGSLVALSERAPVLLFRQPGARPPGAGCSRRHFFEEGWRAKMRAVSAGLGRTATDVGGHNALGSARRHTRCVTATDSRGTRRTRTELVKSQTRAARVHGPLRPAAPAPPRASPPASRPRSRSRRA